MDIKRNKKEKRIQLVGGLIGICVAVLSLFYFFHAEKAEAEKRMVEIVNYVKVQCSTYTNYNESSEAKSLLRAIESARQMSTNIKMETENVGQLSEDFLKENLQTLWVDGIIVLDTEGKTDCEYSTDESLTNEITAYLQKDIIMDFAGYEERVYSERFNREDGSHIDIAACARKDAPGIVAIFYYTSPEFTRNYTLTIQGLLNGYSVRKDGTIIVADDGIVVASNDESLLGENTADNEVVQAMKKRTDSQHIYHLKNEGTGCYGIMLKQRDYYIYTYLPDTEVFHNLSSLHDIGKIRIPEEILNKPGRLTDEEFKIMKTHSELGAAIIKDMDFPQDHPLIHTAWEISRWHHERWDGKGYPDGLKGEEIPISAQVVSMVDVYDALTSERCYKKALDHDTAIQMILDGQCGQFNPILLKCLKELRFQLSKMLDKEMDDNTYYREIQRLSNEILSEKSLPNQNYSQSIVEVMQEKIDFFKSNSCMNSIDYNASSGQLTVLNGKQQIRCQRKNPKFDLFKEFGVNEEAVQHIQALLHQTSVQNKEISVQIKATAGNVYKLKLHTLWSPFKKDGYIGIVGCFDVVK